MLIIRGRSKKILPDGKIEEEKVKKLIFPRYHQLIVVKNLLQSAREYGAGKKIFNSTFCRSSPVKVIL